MFELASLPQAVAHKGILAGVAVVELGRVPQVSILRPGIAQVPTFKVRRNSDLSRCVKSPILIPSTNSLGNAHRTSRGR
jgi:hypothetical protein